MTEQTDSDVPDVEVHLGELMPSLRLDTVFDVLANPRRRFALYALADAPNGVLTLEALIEEVVTMNAGLTDSALTRSSYQEIAADLYHWHLPVLAEVGLIDCDARHRTVRYVDQPTFDRWLTRVKLDELSE